MSQLDALRDALPDWAKDTRLNVGSVIANGSSLTDTQHWGTAIATAAAIGEGSTLRAIVDDARNAGIEQTSIDAALAAFSVMAMNNVFYRGRHWCSDDVSQVPARLRMQVIGNPGVAKVDFELWCLAVSAVLGCEFCVGSHDKVVRDAGLSAENVADALRIAAVVSAAGRTAVVVSALEQATV